MPWYAIVRQLTFSQERWVYSGPLGEPAQLAQPAPVVVPRTSPWRFKPNPALTYTPTSGPLGPAGETVWYFPGRFNPWVDDRVKGTGVGVTPTATVVDTSGWFWWARFRWDRGASRTFSGDNPRATQLGAVLACHAVIKQISQAVMGVVVTDADIADADDLEV